LINPVEQDSSEMDFYLQRFSALSFQVLMQKHPKSDKISNPNNDKNGKE
jgi:hypothetical protein